jgi:anti-anti-sigma factor
MDHAATPPRRSARALRLVELRQLTVSTERDGDIQSIGLAGELDLATAHAVEAELERVEAGDARAIVVDLSKLTFIDSTGVQLLINAQARSRGDSSRLVLTRTPAAVQRVFEICGVDRILPLAR